MDSRVIWRWAGGGAVAATLLALLLLPGRTEPVTREKLRAAEQLWKDAHIMSYDMDLETTGAMTGRYRIEVRHGDLTRMERNGQAADPTERAAWTVDGLFRIIEQDLDMAEHPATSPFPEQSQVWLRMKCHAKLGYPVRYLKQVTNTTMTVEFRVRRLEPKQPPADSLE